MGAEEYERLGPPMCVSGQNHLTFVENEKERLLVCGSLGMSGAVVGFGGRSCWGFEREGRLLAVGFCEGNGIS